MIALALPEIKETMNRLLLSDTFDTFFFEEAEIRKDYTVHLDGICHAEYFEGEAMQADSHVLYESMRPHILHHMKGKHVPLLFKLTLGVEAEAAKERFFRGIEALTPGIAAFLIQIRYDAHGMQLITGVSYASFQPDKTLEKEWDRSIKEFLRAQQIVFEE